MKIAILGLILVGALLSGCVGKASPEVYRAVDNPSDEIILFPDTGKYIVNQTGEHSSYNGEYKIIGDTLYLNHILGTVKMQIVNDSALKYKSYLFLKT